MPSVIIIGIILVYAGFVIYKKVKAMKAGNFCGSCSGCPSAGKCKSIKKET